MDKIHPDIQFLRAVWRSGFIGTFHVAVTTDIFLNFGYNRANFLKFFTRKNSCSQSGVSGLKSPALDCLEWEMQENKLH